MKKIILEKKSMNTLENVIFSFDLLRKKKISPKSICFVSKSHHALRCLLTLKKYFWDITYSCLTYDMEKETLSKKNRLDEVRFDVWYSKKKSTIKYSDM